MRSIKLFIGIIFFLALAGLSNICYAAGQFVIDAPSATGGTGLLRISFPYSLEPGSFSLIGGMNYYYSNELSMTNASNTENIGSFGFVTGGLYKGLEGFAGVIASSTQQYYPQYSSYSLLESIADFRVGLKYAYKINSVFSIGVSGSIQTMSQIQQLFYNFSATGFYGLLLFGYDARRDTKLPLILNINLGYHYDNSDKLLSNSYLTPPDIKTALGIYPSDQYLFSFDILAPIPNTFVTPFIEYNLRKILIESFGDSPQRITPGIRIQPIKPLTIDTAVDIGLSSVQNIIGHNIRAVPAWDLYLSLAYIFKPSFMKAVFRLKRVMPNLQLLVPKNKLPYGWFTGSVYDAKTKEILPRAIISIKGTNVKCSDIITGITTSTYKSCLLNIGPVTIEARKNGYESVTVTRLALPNQGITQNFYLKRIYSFGSFIGRVVDAQGKPILATIKFDKWNVEDVLTDPSTGYFSTNLKPGIYYITILAQGYQPVVSKVIIAEGKKTMLEFVLKK